MIFNNKTELKLSLRFYDGGGSSGSSSSNSAPQLSPQALLQMYGQALPQIANVGGTTNSINSSLANSAASSNPVYTASGLDQLNQYAPGYTASGANVSNLNDLLNSGVLNQGGQALSNSATNLLGQSNPAQAAANGQATNLLNSFNMNGLSGAQQEAVERSLGQSNYATGNLGLDNSTNLVSNAMQFGNALYQKQAALGSALGSAQGVASGQNAAFNPVNTALANPGSTNFGLGTFNPTQANSTITSPLSYTSSIFSPLASNASSQKSTGSSNSSSFSFGI